MASPSSGEERVALQEKIKIQGEVVRKLKSGKDHSEEIKGQVYKLSFFSEIPGNTLSL